MNLSLASFNQNSVLYKKKAPFVEVKGDEEEPSSVGGGLSAGSVAGRAGCRRQGQRAARKSGVGWPESADSVQSLG